MSTIIKLSEAWKNVAIETTFVQCSECYKVYEDDDRTDAVFLKSPCHKGAFLKRGFKNPPNEQLKRSA